MGNPTRGLFYFALLAHQRPFRLCANQESINRQNTVSRLFCLDILEMSCFVLIAPGRPFRLCVNKESIKKLRRRCLGQPIRRCGADDLASGVTANRWQLPPPWLTVRGWCLHVCVRMHEHVCLHQGRSDCIPTTFSDPTADSK